MSQNRLNRPIWQEVARKCQGEFVSFLIYFASTLAGGTCAPNCIRSKSPHEAVPPFA